MNGPDESDEPREILSMFEPDLYDVTDALPGYEHLYPSSSALSSVKFPSTQTSDMLNSGQHHSATPNNIGRSSPSNQSPQDDDSINRSSNKLEQDYDFHGHGGANPLDHSSFSFGPVTSSVFSEDLIMPRIYHHSSHHHQTGLMEKGLLDSMTTGDLYDNSFHGSMMDPTHLGMHHDLGPHSNDPVFQSFSFMSHFGHGSLDAGSSHGSHHVHGLDSPDDHGLLLPPLRNGGLDNSGDGHGGRDDLQQGSQHGLGLNGPIEVILPSPSWAPQDTDMNHHPWMLNPSSLSLDTTSSDSCSDSNDLCSSDVTPMLSSPQFTLKTLLPANSSDSTELKQPKSPRRPVLVVKGEVRPNTQQESPGNSKESGKSGTKRAQHAPSASTCRNRSRNSSKSSTSSERLQEMEPTVKKVSLENIQLTEDMLRDWKVQDLNRTLKGMPKELRIKVKKDRRTLKNRVYAHNSRHKKNSELKECKEELAKVKSTNEKLDSDFAFVFKKLGQCREFLFKVVNGWQRYTDESSHGVSRSERRFVAELMAEAQSEFLGVTSSKTEKSQVTNNGFAKNEAQQSCDSFSGSNHRNQGDQSGVGISGLDGRNGYLREF